MKYPKRPTKPYPPYKPTPPPKTMEQKTLIGNLTSQENGEHTLESFEILIKEQAEKAGVDPATVKFSWEIEKDHGYYDDVTYSLTMNLYTVSTIDSPKYDKMKAYYEAGLVTYHQDYAKYTSDLKKYHLEEKKYKKDLEQWTLEHAKATVKRLESKVKK